MSVNNTGRFICIMSEDTIVNLQKEGKGRVDNGGMDIKEGVLAWKSGLKVPLLPLGPSCPLQTILLSDLVGRDNSLQMVMAVWNTFLNDLK
jgi:hypothetical protein